MGGCDDYMTNVYINVAVTGSVNRVLNELLSSIDKSGLYDFSNKIFLVINGDKSQLDFQMRDKYVIWNPNNDISHCEFPTLDLIWFHCQKEDNLNVVYLHTKGITKPNHAGVIDWTEYLTYFNVDRWAYMLTALGENDVVGVNFGGNRDDLNEHPSTWGYGKAPLHFSGNFWWSKSSHIRTLTNPYQFIPDNNYMRYRVACEMWVCSNGDGKYLGVWHSNVNHYSELYPRDRYVISD